MPFKTIKSMVADFHHKTQAGFTFAQKRQYKSYWNQARAKPCSQHGRSVRAGKKGTALHHCKKGGVLFKMR